VLPRLCTATCPAPLVRRSRGALAELEPGPKEDLLRDFSGSRRIFRNATAMGMPSSTLCQQVLERFVVVALLPDQLLDIVIYSATLILASGRARLQPNSFASVQPRTMCGEYKTPGGPMTITPEMEIAAVANSFVAYAACRERLRHQRRTLSHHERLPAI
jgi:hypothetical protein